MRELTTMSSVVIARPHETLWQEVYQRYEITWKDIPPANLDKAGRGFKTYDA
jgi:hypothetical protein